MSTAPNSVAKVTRYPESWAVSATLYRADNRIARNPERAETSVLDAIVGRRGSLRAILSQVEAVAGTNTTVLLSGETGTGKEVIARAIHDLSPRRNRNLVKVNCASATIRQREPADMRTVVQIFTELPLFPTCACI